MYDKGGEVEDSSLSSPPEDLATPSACAPGGLFCISCGVKPIRYKSQKLCHSCYLLPPSQRGKPRKKIRRMLRATCAYDTAHTRCKNLWGSASNYPCVKCGEKAREWAYDGTDPTQMKGVSGAPNTARQERRGGEEMWYSAWPEFYMPMCSSCHAAFDNPDAKPTGINPDW